ncbi:MAG: polysaccharide biosynthesis tyrosine autokinase [Thermosynechococcaceae cyanobacterium]
MHPDQEATSLESAKGYETAEYLGLNNWGAANSAPQRGLNLNPLRRLIQRNFWLVFVPTLAAAGITLWVLAITPRSYSGSFQVLVEPTSSDGKLQLDASSSGGSNNDSEIDYLTLVQVLTSPSVLSGIVQKIDSKYPSVDYDFLIKNLVVERVEKNPAEQTKILKVTYESSDPQEILFVLNELATGYLKFGLEDRKTRIGGGVVFIEQQLPGLKRRVETLEGQLQVLQQQHKISDLESEGAELAQQARQVQSQQMETQRDLDAQKRLASNLQQQLNGATPTDVLKASSLSENPRYQTLLGQLKQVEAQIATESAQFEPEYPGLQTLQEQRKNLINLITQESRKLVGSSNVPQFQNSIQKTMSQQLIDSLNQSQLLEVRNQALIQANSAIDQQMRQFPEIKRRYNDLQAQLEIAQNTLKQLQLKRESLRVEAAQKEVPWRLLSKPNLLKDAQGQLIASSRKGLQKLLLGTLGGFLLGLGIAILREKRQDIFYSLEDLQEDLQWPLVGAFPLSARFPDHPSWKSTRNRQPQIAADLLQDGSSDLAKAAEGLYTNLRFLPIEPQAKSLVIASLSGKDGKTMATTHLAKAVASMGQRVLVVDANMMLPQVHTWLDVPNFEGLVEVLTKSIDPNQLIQRSPLQSNLFVLTAGQAKASSRKLMASQPMQHLMSQLHTLFDLVIYDTPPLQQYPDANLLALHADGLLMVVSIRKTRRSQVLKLLKKMQGARIPIMGIVANQVQGLQDANAPDTNEPFDPLEDEFEMFRVSPS